MSSPALTKPEKTSDALTQSRDKQEKTSRDLKGKDEVNVDDHGGSAPMSGLSLGSEPAPKQGRRGGGASIISGMRSRREEATGSPATGSGVRAVSAEASTAEAIGGDRSKFDELVGKPVQATVLQASQSEDEAVLAMAVQLDERYAALRAKLPEARSALEKAVTALLNYRAAVEREATEVARLRDSDLPATVRFGTEITFSDPKLHDLFVDPDEKCNPKKLKDSQTAASAYLHAWAKLVASKFPTDRKSGFVLDIAPASPLTLDGATRFSFSAQVRDFGGQHTVNWWYQTNVDNCCLELQMAPTTLPEFQSGLISKWANHIFEVAGKLGLQSGRGGMGGGHLSMDRASSFGNSAIIFSRMVQRYNDLARTEGLHSAYPDNDAPFIREMDAKSSGKLAGDYDALMKRVNEAVLDPDSAISVEQVRDGLWELLKKAVPLKEKLNNAGRYTALNIEPVTEADKPKQRVEFRRFEGQVGIAELCGQLEDLLALVETSVRPD